MRFLLHAQPVQRAATVAASKQAGAITHWGQQCSPNCGCVVRFEARKADDGKPEVLSYTAKQVVSMQTENGEREAVLTSKGRPMLQSCTCENVHHLSACLVNHYNASPKWQEGAINDAQFRKLRSSPAFARTVLRSQGLPLEASACWDLVEEAWTAMTQGRMPLARQRPAHHVSPVVPRKEEEEDEAVPMQFDYDVVDDSYGFPQYPFTHQSSGNKYSLSSTISMFDQSQAEQHSRNSRLSTRPFDMDWETYVDQLYENRAHSSYPSDQASA